MKRWIWALIVIAIVCSAIVIVAVSNRGHKDMAIAQPSMATATAAGSSGDGQDIQKQLDRTFDLIHQGDWREAERQLTGIANNAELPPWARFRAYCFLGDMYGTLPDMPGCGGDRKKAEKMLEQALQIGEQNNLGKTEISDALTIFGMVLAAQGKLAEAEGKQAKAITLNPHNSRALLNLTMLYIKQGKADQAKRIFEKIMQLLNSQHNSVSRESRIMNQEAIIGAYIEFAQQIAFYAENYPTVQKQLNKALILIDGLGQTDFACKNYEKIGWLFLRIRDARKAKECFQKAIVMNRKIGIKMAAFDPNSGLMIAEYAEANPSVDYRQKDLDLINNNIVRM